MTLFRGILSALSYRRSERKPNQKQQREGNNPFSIPVGPGDDLDLRVIAGPRAQYPKKRGKAPEQFAQELRAYHQELREKSAASFHWTRKRAQSAGSTSYRWRTSRDSDVCETCAKREAKRYLWNSEPTHGHAGMVNCCPSGHCRCYPEPEF